MTGPDDAVTVTFDVGVADYVAYRLGLYRAREALRERMTKALRQADSARGTARLAASRVGNAADLPALTAEATYLEDEANRCREAIDALSALLEVLMTPAVADRVLGTAPGAIEPSGPAG